MSMVATQVSVDLSNAAAVRELIESQLTRISGTRLSSPEVLGSLLRKLHHNQPSHFTVETVCLIEGVYHSCVHEVPDGMRRTLLRQSHEAARVLTAFVP